MTDKPITCMFLIFPSALTLFESHMVLGDVLLANPLKSLAAFDRALQEAQQTVFQGIDDADRMDLVWHCFNIL